MLLGWSEGDDSGGERAQLCHPINRRREGRPLYLTKKSTVAAGEGRMPASNMEQRFMLICTLVRFFASTGGD